MRRRVQMFVSVVILLGSIAGAVAISQIKDYGFYSSVGHTPGWARWLAVGVLIVGVASPIVTWPRPIWLRRRDRSA